MSALINTPRVQSEQCHLVTEGENTKTHFFYFDLAKQGFKKLNIDFFKHFTKKLSSQNKKEKSDLSSISAKYPEANAKEAADNIK